MLTARQKIAARLIEKAGAAGTPQERAKNMAKVIEALALPGKEVVQEAGELRKKAPGTEPFELLAAICHERLEMYLDAGRVYMKLGLVNEIERLVKLHANSPFNSDKYQAAMVAILLPDFAQAASIAEHIERTEMDFITIERARKNEAVHTQSNLVLAGKIYAELFARDKPGQGWADHVHRVTGKLLWDNCFGEAAILHMMLEDEQSAKSVAGLIVYNKDRQYDDDVFQALLNLGMKAKVEEIAESILREPSRLNRTIRAAEIFAMAGNSARAAKIFIECERYHEALAVLGIEK